MTTDVVVQSESNSKRATPAWYRNARRVALSPEGLTLILLIIIAILAPLLAPHNPTQSNPAAALLPPSAKHWFGTDSFGFDVFSRVLYATRIDLIIALGGVAIGIVIGVALGALAGYAGGYADGILMRLVEMFQSFPQLLFAMIIFAAIGNSTVNLVGIIALLNAVFYVRLVRSMALTLRDVEYVLAAKVAGLPTRAIVVRHVVPRVLGPVFGQFAVSAAFAIQLVAGLGFLGLGVRLPEPEWGSMIQIGAGYIIDGQWWPAVFPGLAIVVTTWALMGVGRRLRRIAEGR